MNTNPTNSAQTTQKLGELIPLSSNSPEDQLPSFAKKVEDLPNGCLLFICDMPFRVYNNDNSVFVALKIASRWQDHEVTFARINYLTHWIKINSNFINPVPVVNILSLSDAKHFVCKVIELEYSTNNSRRIQSLEFTADLFSIRFNNYKIGGK